MSTRHDDYIIQFILAREEERRAQAAQHRRHQPVQALSPPTLGSEGSKVIHITDLQDFCRCKRAWNWASMLRMGLQPAVTPVPLFFGSAIHYALDYGYRGCLGKSVALFDLKAAQAALRGWLKDHVRRTVEYTGPLWDFEKESVDEVLNLGALMLQHYALWVEPLDKLFRMLGTEYKFKVLLPGYEEHGMEYAGRFDGYIEDLRSGTRYILEFKTTKSIRSFTGQRSASISGVLRGMQSAAYTWASGQLPAAATAYGPARGVLYRFLLKRAPDLPKPLQAGGYSRAKTIKSTVAYYRWALRKIAEQKLAARPAAEENSLEALEVLYESEIRDASAALAVLRERQDISHGLVVGNEFFLQLPMVKKEDQVRGVLAALVEEGKRMTDPSQPIYPTSGFHCNWCSFRAPCDMIAYGHEDQVQAILDAAYGPRTYWEPEVEEEY